MQYSDFLRYCNHIIKISNTINDGWTLKSHEDQVYLLKTVSRVNLIQSELSEDELDLQSATSGKDITKWEYHIIYSISYQVPVMYFNVWKSNGALLSLDELWSSVHPNFQKAVGDNKWYTLTQQEHPYLHRPYFYFHPCETSAFMGCFRNDGNKLITWLSSIGQEINMDEGGVLEGFLCPICVVDLKTAVQLNAHFQEQHSDDQDLFKSVKDMYEKAKKKILEKPSRRDQVVAEADSASGPVLKSTPGYRPSSINAELGALRNHTEYFKSIRTFRMERYAAQTNNLLIRLDKLLINLPTDPVKRKAHEQKVVPWLNEKDVNLCPGCAKTFGILRRKHHCRLCGAVMCNECTCLLSLDAARKMTTTSVASSNLLSEMPQNPSSKDSTPVKKLLKSPSSASVQSVLSLDLTNESFFRLCAHCHKLLEIRQKLKEGRNQKPIISQFYDKLRNAISDTDPLLGTYTKMYHSLCAGETTYNLMDAQGVRVKILRLADVIDNISKKIAILGQTTENPPQGSQLVLQKSVRDAAAHYLKENIITLPSLPTEEQIQRYQEQRRLEMARKIEQAHEAERQAHEAESRNFGFESRNRNSYIPVNNTSLPSQDPKVVVEDGWTPDVNVSIVSDNPIIQQMNIIRGFIKQAKLANKLDEVATLEQNLRELKEALYRQNEENNLERAASEY